MRVYYGNLVPDGLRCRPSKGKAMPGSGSGFKGRSRATGWSQECPLKGKPLSFSKPAFSRALALLFLGPSSTLLSPVFKFYTR